jgi:hypothetical protein
MAPLRPGLSEYLVPAWSIIVVIIRRAPSRLVSRGLRAPGCRNEDHRRAKAEEERRCREVDLCSGSPRE